jgi:hypothetical protein
MEQNICSEANNRLGGEQILPLLWNPKVHYHVND